MTDPGDYKPTTGPSGSVIMLVIMAVSTFMFLSMMFGCCSTQEPEIVYQPYEVKVPVQTAPPPIEVPDEPEYETPAQDCTGYSLACVRAMTRDFLAALAYAAELRWRVDAHNEAISE